MSAPRRVIDLTEDDLAALIDSRLAVLLATQSPANDPDAALDRAGAAALLGISLSKLDLLCRREHEPLPFHRVGDVRRFLRCDLYAWLRRQREVAS